ncbi:RNA polymerase sigma factor [Parabacteroides sp. PF5-9]|uniref:RNA polymerase sigma factor n=1 Tax=Parabacteroides sp. PF5-9 TaxID=1742404 RepID=UPI002475C79D|nr:RNA polymerase sigma factor [Parabacteroides sp. PF5-9]MDH6358534.1 RNA polymerase sigma factor (sigma-70 family) [Parabacteroides sp. PF5-9]
MNTLQFQKTLLGMQDNLMNFALMLTANKDDAADLLQDTTLKVLDNQEKYVDNVNFKGWVMTVMRNIFINNYHKIVRTQSVIDQGADIYNLEVMSESGYDSPDGSYQLQEINKAVERLSDDLRVPFALFVSGYRYHEIADKLNLPLGTVKSRIFFARQDLQKSLKAFHA